MTRQRLHLLHEDRRRVRKVTTDERTDARGQFLLISRFQIIRWPEHFEESAASHLPCTDAGAQRHPEHPRSRARAIFAAPEGAEQREAPHAFGTIERELLR